TDVDEGLHVWKMYNMGFIVRTPRRCIGFDLHPGGRTTGPLSRTQQRDLVELLDVVFVSHLHADHLHTGFLKRLLDAGKTVVLPPTLRPGLQRANAIRLYASRPTRFHTAGVEVVCLPGWQRLYARNNVYLVTVDGHRVLHNGDNTRHGVYLHLADEEPIDVVLANCWSGFGHGDHIHDAAVLITGHENELGHAVSMRAPYRSTYAKFDRLGLADGSGGSSAGPDCHVLSWGEGLRCRPGGQRESF
ncbi:MAG: MBL fold metallo-hydrolase, partial [Planctomycetota bacterium]